MASDPVGIGLTSPAYHALFLGEIMNKKKATKRQKKAVTNKKQYFLITDIANEQRNTSVVPFDSKEELIDYVVDELEEGVSYEFGDDDIVIYGELQKVSVTEKTYKMTVR